MDCDPSYGIIGRVMRAREKDMDFVRMRKLITERGERVVMMEDGEPAIVVMSFAEYERMVALPRGENGRAGYPSAPVPEEMFSLSADEHEWQMDDEPETAFIPDEQPSASAGALQRARLDEIRLEDLPL